MDGPKPAEAADWIDENWESIHCLSMSMAEFTFSAARSITTFGDGSGSWLVFAWEAANNIGNSLNCFPPPFEDVEAWVGVTTPQCQCAELPGQLVLQYVDGSGALKRPAGSDEGSAKKINSYSYVEGVTTCWYENASGAELTSTFTVGEVSDLRWYIVPPLGTGCCADELPPIPNIGTPERHPVDYPEADEQYRYEVVLIDSCIDKFGYLRNCYLLLRISNSSGREYYDAFWWESIDGPIKWDKGVTRAFEGFYSDPPYGPPHRDAAIPISGGGNCNPGLSAVNYAVSAGCTWNEEEEKYDTVYDAPVNETDNGILGLAWRLDAIAYLLEKVNLIPYDVCARKKPELDGDWISTRWVSDGDSPASTSRLRKLFRYRSKSTRTPDELRAFWSGFAWEAGSVVVGHKGAWWGTPKVWAASAEEGKRVLRFAAGEAGLDPDMDGEWYVATSRDPRYGQPGTMRLAKPRGEYWVTRREGPSGPASS